jgi:hypothetical protein
MNMRLVSPCNYVVVMPFLFLFFLISVGDMTGLNLHIRSEFGLFFSFCLDPSGLVFVGQSLGSSVCPEIPRRTARAQSRK